MTIDFWLEKPTHPLYDEQVPNSTTTIPGVDNMRIPIIGHQFAITLTLTLLKRRIIQFIQS